MIQKIFNLLAIIIFTINTNAQTKIFDTLLKNNVDSSGNVNYTNIKKDIQNLDTYLDYLNKTTPDKNWSNNKTKAFWINAYNAYTIKLITDHYPLKTIKQISIKGKNAWDIPFAKVDGKTYTLNYIEHQILRKNFNDPRIHIGVNCASNSCPQLGNFAFTEANYEDKTNELMKKFINDTSKNNITGKKIYLSRIFDWFKGDFTKKEKLIDYLNRYANTEIDKKAKVKFLDYDWGLNGK